MLSRAYEIICRLYGVTCLQGVQYFDRFYNDPSVLKFLVRPLIRMPVFRLFVARATRLLYYGNSNSSAPGWQDC